MGRTMEIIAVTSCATGIAETYMAADVLEHCAKSKGYNIKVETQGALGIINTISEQELRTADVAILTNDVAIENEERFHQIKTIRVSIREILENPQKIISSL